MKHSVLITGINGYIGQYLSFTRPHNVELAGSVRDARPNSNPVLSGIPLIYFDLMDDPGLHLSKIKPSVVIHTAAMANLAECEQSPERAFQINAEATGRLARWCAQNEARFVYLSTDIVFSGQSPPYDEQAQPDPINAYGRSKLAGERAVASESSDFAILRIALVLGRGLFEKQNFIDWLLRGIESGEPVRLFADEIRTPTAAYELAQLIWQIALTGETEIFHLGGSERISRYELGQRICAKIGRGMELLEPIRSAGLKGYPRPLDVSLLSTRIQTGKSITMPAISSSLDSILKKYV